ncbi:uncharacterized protein LOC108151109 [Drosophila miranda]
MSDFDSRLIRLVGGNPQLLKRKARTAPYSLRKNAEEEIWGAIATSLQADVKTCTSRWEHLKSKLQQELAKEGEGVASTWNLMPTMRDFKPGRMCGISPQPSDPLIEEVHDEENNLQEAMDCSVADATKTLASGSAQIPSSTLLPDFTADATMRRVGTMLEGFGEENCAKAAKRIIEYLCHCTLHILKSKPIDDLVI